MKHSSTQLSFLQDDPQQPVPILTAEQFNFPLQRHTLDNDDLVYSLQDWIAGLTGENDTKKIAQMWNVFKKQTSILNRTLKLPYLASDGKTYPREFGGNKVLFAFAAYMRNLKTRPQIALIKEFLAKAGAFTDDLQQDLEAGQQAIQSERIRRAIAEGKSPEWINTRELSVITRNQFTAAIQKANPEYHIGDATNGIYRGTLGTNAAGLRKILNLGERQNPRDHMSEIALIYTMASEAAVRAQLSGYGGDELLPIHVIQSVIATLATATGKQAQETATLIGVDLITGKPLLGSGKK